MTRGLDSTPLGLSPLSQRELRDLLRAVEAGWLDFPCNDLNLSQAGVEPHHRSQVRHVLSPCTPEAARNLLEAAIAERIYRPPPRLELVWTGPEAHGSTARDTGIVVQHLFQRANKSVIIGGFRFDHGAHLFRPLHEAMLRTGLEVAMFVDIEGHTDTASEARPYAERAIGALLRDNWPFGPPFPAVYYDPRSAIAGPPWVSLHAKCIVVDDCIVFVTSANFTERGQTRNIEVGVQIEDSGFARLLAQQWRSLVTGGLVERYAG